MMISVYDMRNELHPRRLTIAMWDFSWLNGHYPSGPFENFNKVVDELLERSFNTVRIDCFPLIIGMLNSKEDLITIPGAPLDNWGVCDVDRKHPIVEELVQFMSVTKEKGVYVILSTWNFGCQEFANIRDPYKNDKNAFRKAWERTLDILGEKDLLSHVLYVDLDQEFPYFSPYYDSINNVGLKEMNELTMERSLASNMEAAVQTGVNKKAWIPEQIAFVHDLQKEMLDHFQYKYPFMRFTYSLTSFWKEVRASGIRSFDVLEPHIWIHSDRFESRIGFNKILKDRGKHDYSDYQKRINEALRSLRPMYLQEINNQLSYVMEWAKEIAAPVVTTEAWGPWWHMDHPDLSWNWLREWCAECNDLAGKYGFWGSTPWNYSHPYWENWQDISWYREVNSAFMRS